MAIASCALLMTSIRFLILFFTRYCGLFLSANTDKLLLYSGLACTEFYFRPKENSPGSNKWQETTVTREFSIAQLPVHAGTRLPGSSSSGLWSFVSHS